MFEDVLFFYFQWQIILLVIIDILDYFANVIQLITGKGIFIFILEFTYNILEFLSLVHPLNEIQNKKELELEALTFQESEKPNPNDIATRNSIELLKLPEIIPHDSTSSIGNIIFVCTFM